MQLVQWPLHTFLCEQHIFIGGINKEHQVFGCICSLSKYLAKLVH